MKVSNPLSTIAIFSGLAESFATVALIFLPPEIQSIFVYFVMAFPAGLVVLFFLVLYYKNTVLYAPSDYEDQAHYLEVNTVRKNVSEVLRKDLTKLEEQGRSLTKTEIEQTIENVTKSVDQTVTERENTVLKLRNNGLKTNEIAMQLGLSTRTVQVYLHQLAAKGLLSTKASIGL